MATFEQRTEIVNNTRKWLGTPWQTNQKTLGVGVDCVQLALASISPLGVYTGLTKYYYQTPNGNELKDYLDSLPSLKPVDEIKEGNILLFRVKKVPHHIGICTAPNTMIHASTSRGVVEQEIRPWLHRIVSIYEVIV